ncbi:hypothetical protein [Bordetella sp. LUAb4]|uniref:hypothetical protein n=1 Tax=Bordetella sp. LUAb4 TaxID=2843195 RepID=UPI001E43518B|nr:hypothetical protein [Bordetella sp. LUAb4]
MAKRRNEMRCKARQGLEHLARQDWQMYFITVTLPATFRKSDGRDFAIAGLAHQRSRRGVAEINSQRRDVIARRSAKKVGGLCGTSMNPMI